MDYNLDLTATDGVVTLAGNLAGETTTLGINGLTQRLSLQEILPLAERLRAWEASPASVSEPFVAEVGGVEEGDVVLVGARLRVARVGTDFTVALERGSTTSSVTLTDPELFAVLHLLLSFAGHQQVNYMVEAVWTAAQRRTLH